MTMLSTYSVKAPRKYVLKFKVTKLESQVMSWHHALEEDSPSLNIARFSS